MTITQSEEYTIQLLKQYLPNDWQNWKVHFFYSNKVLGRCYRYRKVIELSLWAIQNTTSESVQETIKHEVAHAVANAQYGFCGHSILWKSVCHRIGCSPEEYSKVTLIE